MTPAVTRLAPQAHDGEAHDEAHGDHARPERVVLVLYTTRYREGGAAFRRAARTLAREKRSELPGHDVIERAVERKHEFVAVFDELARDGRRVSELHFIGHSGMYGIMFGTTAWPEQMSPWEWRHLHIPFAPGARACFHACRTARWFTPFFARTYGVRASGYFWYTTVSRRPDRFALDVRGRSMDDAWIVSVHGRKSRGLSGSVNKHLLRAPLLPMIESTPARGDVDTGYDDVAHLYDETFADAGVRRDELRFLREALSSVRGGRVLDIGCGTGSFLHAARDLFVRADGVDLSAKMIEHAQRRAAGDPGLAFTRVDGPKLPFEDASFDVVSSVLSFRYLDWDPVVAEILRVLKPGGRLVVVDMVAKPLSPAEAPRFVVDKLRQTVTELSRPSYRRALRRMVEDPAWERMLTYNPIRAEHELRWYLQSRFPGGELRVINRGRHARVLAFLSAPLFQRAVAPQSYP